MKTNTALPIISASITTLLSQNASAGIVPATVNKTVGFGSAAYTSYSLDIGTTGKSIKFSKYSSISCFIAINGSGTVMNFAAAQLKCNMFTVWNGKLAQSGQKMTTIASHKSFGNINFGAGTSAMASVKNKQDWSSGGYLLFSFKNGSGVTCYGWVEVMATYATYSTSYITIVSWAYDDTGAVLAAGVGAVPEPADTAVGLAGLALGAAGLRRWRKSRKA